MGDDVPLGKVVGLYDFTPSDPYGLEFKKGDVIVVYQCLESGWWDGSFEDKRGWFPSNFTTPLNSNEVEIIRNEWITQKSSSGKLYYYNQITGESSWEKPGDYLHEDDVGNTSSDSLSLKRESTIEIIEQQLPLGWSAHETEQGLIFYYHRESNKVQWTFPDDDDQDIDAQLPEEWGEKVSEDGRVYFYNMVTNETCWKRSDVTKLTLRKGSIIEKKPLTPGEEIDVLLQSESIEKLKAHGELGKVLTRIFESVLDLNESAKVNGKSAFTTLTKVVVKSIQTLFKATKTNDSSAPVLLKSKKLTSQHKHLTDCLSNLVLASKLASGVWPPPDAVSKMQQNMLEMISSISHFVIIALEVGVTIETDIELPERLTKLPPPIAKKPRGLSMMIENQSQSQSQIQNQNQNQVQNETPENNAESPTSSGRESFSDERHEQASQEEQQTDVYRIADLDICSKKILRLVEELLSHIRKTGTQKSTSDEKKTFFVEPASKIGALVSRIINISDEIEDKDNTLEYKQLKLKLYDSISGLFQTAQQAAEPLAPSDALRNLMTSIQSVVSSVRTVVIACKTIVAKKEQAENEALLNNFSSSQDEPKLKRIQSMAMENGFSRGESELKRFDSTPDLRSQAQGKDDDDDDDDDDPTTKRKTSNKLANFFGEAPPQSSGSKKLSNFFGVSVAKTTPTKSQTPAYLLPGYGPKELVFNMEGKVKGGTLPALIERLTQHDVVDTDFLNTFLMTYKSFTTPQVVLDSIIQRFLIAIPDDLTKEQIEEFKEKKLTPIRLRVTNVLKTWIENYFEDFEDNITYKTLNDFINQTLKSSLKNPAEQLTKLLQKKVTGTISKKIVLSGQAPLPIISKSLNSATMKLTELDPLEVARQLSLMDSKIFNQIKHAECIEKAWSTPESIQVSPNIRELIERSNRLTAWVVQTILIEENPRIRLAILRFFISLAEKCRLLNNFNSLMAILAALSSAPIHRLKKTWAGIPSKERKALESLRKLMDTASNFSRYREALRTSPPPSVPFLGLYLTDLTFIEDGNPSFLKGSNLINFDKRTKVATVIQEIKQYQVSQYCLQDVPLIQDSLLVKFKNVQSIDSLYDQSLKIEPRESTDDNVLRLIHENGMH